LGTRISRDFDFLAAVYFEGNFLINNYSVSLTFTVDTDSIHEQNIAMDRIKFFVNQQLENCVFVQDTEAKIIEKYQNADLKICCLPEEPYDQIITVLLLYKINAICEGRLIATDIQLNSMLSDDVGFLYDIDDLTNQHPYKNGWWTDSSTTITSNVSGKKEKIVKLVKKTDWANLGLDWKEKENCNEIFFMPETEK
jgi:hypothetical protein